MSKYTQEEHDRANEFATKLDDHNSILLHLSFVRNYEEWSLQEQLEKVLETPDSEIRTTRARYYTSLVKQYGVRKNTRN